MGSATGAAELKKIMATFNCNWQQLKQVAADFIRAAPTADTEELEAGLDCFNLHYLGLETSSAIELHQAAILFNIVGNEYHKAEFALLQAA